MTFDPTRFTMAPRSYALCGVLGRGDDQDELNKRFGSHWKRIPGHSRVLYAADKVNNVQMTLLLTAAGEPIEFAVYTEESFDLFKEQFGKETMDCTYHTIDPLYKHMGLQVVKVLKEQDFW